MLTTFRASALAAAILLSSGFAAAQDALFLTPERFQAAPGESVLLRAQAGHAEALDKAPWPAARVRWLFIRGAGTQQNLDSAAPENATPDAVKLMLPPPDAAQIGLDLKPTIVNLPLSELKAFATKYAPDSKLEPLGDRAGATIRVRRVESAKTLVRVIAAGQQPTPSATARSKSGQAVELRLMTDPTATRVGSDLALRFHIDGSPREGATIRAASAAGGQTLTATSDASGFARLRLTSPGVWRIEAHSISVLQNDPEADAALHTATLTFEVPAEDGK